MEKVYDLGLEVGPEGSPTPFPEILTGERLARLHPHWFVETPTQDGPRFSSEIKDYATEAEGRVAYDLSFSDPELITLAVREGPVDGIVFFREAGLLKVRVEYPAEELTEEEENNVLLWVRGIREYLAMYLKKNLVTIFYRALMNKVVLKMNPSQRKISLMIWRLTLLELLVIVLIVVGYFLFMR